MSRRYKIEDEIPDSIIIARLKELSNVVTEGREAVAREFVMRIPAEPDHDADLVLSTAAKRLSTLRAELDRVRGAIPSPMTEYKGYVPPEDGSAREYYVEGWNDCLSQMCEALDTKEVGDGNPPKQKPETDHAAVAVSTRGESSHD